MAARKYQMEVEDPNYIEVMQAEPRKYFRIYKTILEIMDSRDYVVPDDSKDLTFAEFLDKYENGDYRDKKDVFRPLEIEENEEQDPSIAVFYNFKNEPITEEYIKMVIQTVPKTKKFFLLAPTNEKSKTNAILLDKKAQNFIQELGKKDKDDKDAIRVEVFKQEDLLFNVLKHDLVPEHKLLTEKQKIELLQKYKVKESQLPKILLSDPVAKFLGIRRGQVVKISRKSETAGTYTTYRIAV